MSITYKILYNDAVAMTGGQPVDGQLSVPQITRQLAAEGVQRIVVVTQDTGKYGPVDDLAPGVQIEQRERLDAVQRQLREYRGVSALIYDQTCAAELRRRRKRGRVPRSAAARVHQRAGLRGLRRLQPGVQLPVGGAGRDRVRHASGRIDQSSCNKDFSCLKGFCPSFVTVRGGTPRKRARADAANEAVCTAGANRAVAGAALSILVTGVGGTGVVTHRRAPRHGGAPGGARHHRARQHGLAQKGGAVVSHIRLAPQPAALYWCMSGQGQAPMC